MDAIVMFCATEIMFVYLQICELLSDEASITSVTERYGAESGTACAVLTKRAARVQVPMRIQENLFHQRWGAGSED
ncbi:hypothetical protein BH11PAT4_BH11PAT4_7700 [soil metagenome]